MRKIITTLCLTLSAVYHAEAMIGQTEAEMAKENGLPSETTPEGFKVYHNGQLELHAHFTEGKSDNTVYIADPNVGFTDHIVSTFLCVESSGLAWIVDANSTPERMLYNTPHQEFHAILLSRSKLSVFTDAFYQKIKRETGH